MSGKLSRSAFAAGVCLLFAVTGIQAQQATVAGSIIDQAAKSIAGANVIVRSDNSATTVTVTVDANGHFTSPIAPGTYTIEVTSPGFAKAVRTGVQVSSGKSEAVTITLNVGAVSQSVTVQDTIVLAADTAPEGNTLDAVAARTEITPAVIQDFMAPVADFAEVVQQAPGAFSTNPNGIGLGQGKSYFRGFPDGDYTMTFDGIPFEDTNSPTHHS